MQTSAGVTLVHGEDELFALARPLFTTAADVSCAAEDAHTWAASRQRLAMQQAILPGSVRKLYRPGAVLDTVQRAHLHELKHLGADIRITPDELNETIILDRRVAILAGERVSGVRNYAIVARPEVIQSVTSLFDAAWRTAMGIDVFEARFAEVRALAPRILEMLTSGCKDESAARALGMGLRTYRRRVAELMGALGATSRFQAGVRARELGLV